MEELKKYVSLIGDKRKKHREFYPVILFCRTSQFLNAVQYALVRFCIILYRSIPFSTVFGKIAEQASELCIHNRPKKMLKTFDILSQFIFLLNKIEKSLIKLNKVQTIFRTHLFFVPMKHNGDKQKCVYISER